jgi:Flp pilus assembly protein TadG
MSLPHHRFEHAQKGRRGTAAVEFAICAPLVIFAILFIMIGSQGVFCYHQVASLAREGSRWAIVHGSEYERETGQAAATADSLLSEVIQPSAVMLDPQHLTCQIAWNRSNQPLEVVADYDQPVGNTVTVTVSYQWFPQVLLTGPYTLTSTSTMQMAY